MFDEYIFEKVMERHGLTFKRLAADPRFRFHVAERQIRKYAHGEAETPTWAWAALYDITQDISILQVIVGSQQLITLPQKQNNSQEYSAKLRASIEALTRELERLANER